MSERAIPISRVPVPVKASPAGIERVVITGEPGKAEPPISGVLIGIWRGRWIVVACVALFAGLRIHPREDGSSHLQRHLDDLCAAVDEQHPAGFVEYLRTVT